MMSYPSGKDLLTTAWPSWKRPRQEVARDGGAGAKAAESAGEPPRGSCWNLQRAELQPPNFLKQFFLTSLSAPRRRRTRGSAPVGRRTRPRCPPSGNTQRPTQSVFLPRPLSVDAALRPGAGPEPGRGRGRGGAGAGAGAGAGRRTTRRTPRPATATATATGMGGRDDEGDGAEGVRSSTPPRGGGGAPRTDLGWLVGGGGAPPFPYLPSLPSRNPSPRTTARRRRRGAEPGGVRCW